MARQSTAFSFDVILVGSAFLLIVLGILFIYSSGVTLDGQQTSSEYIRQIVWAILGLLLMAGAALVKMDWIKALTPAAFILCLVLMILTIAFGRVVNGARAWIGVGELGIQPSEFAKVGFILFMARFLEDSPKGVQTIPGLLKPLVLLLLPVMGLVLLQPDLGTSLVFFPVALIMLLFAGARRRHVFFLACVAFLTIVFSGLPIWEANILQREVLVLSIFQDQSVILTVSIMIATLTAIAAAGYLVAKNQVFYWIAYSLIIIALSYGASFLVRAVLKDYQIMRLIVFIDPAVDRLGSGWHIIQSTIAVGSGGLLGKGYLNGTQSQLQYLPEQSTDFIFSIISEEFGFVGAVLVFILYGLVIFRCLRISYQAKDRFGRYVGVGVATMFFFHFSVNVGMTIGLMPITGIPLLLVSYGGSNLWMSLIAIGLLVNIGSNRFRY